MIPFLSRTAIVAALVLAVSATAAAQAQVQSDSALSVNSVSSVNSVTPVPRSGPTIMAPAVNATVAFRPAQQNIVPAVRRRESFSRPAVLMIVGGALIVTGLIVGDEASTILYIAGAGIGGYGLYLHLQSPNARLMR